MARITNYRSVLFGEGHQGKEKCNRKNPKMSSFITWKPGIPTQKKTHLFLLRREVLRLGPEVGKFFITVVVHGFTQVVRKVVCSVVVRAVLKVYQDYLKIKTA